MTIHEIEIDSPQEIFEAVRYTAEQGRDEVSRVALDHNHTSVVRGYGERKTGLNEELDIEDYPVEIHRDDGGNTWYHSPESRCLMLGVPNPDNKRNTEELSQAWGGALSTKLESYLDEENLNFDNVDPVYLERTGTIDESEAWDVYDRNTGKQLFGLSVKNNFENSTVVRACFYDGVNHGGEFDNILEADNQDVEDFHDSYRPLNGFYEWIKQDLGSIGPDLELEGAEPYIQNNRGRRSPKPCVNKVDIAKLKN